MIAPIALMILIVLFWIFGSRIVNVPIIEKYLMGWIYLVLVLFVVLAYTTKPEPVYRSRERSSHNRAYWQGR